MPLDYEALTAPFPPDEIEWRVGSTTQDKKKGMALAYIDARAVMDRLDDVVGMENWQCRYAAIGDNKTACEIGIWSPPFNDKPGEWVWKGDGAGDTDFEGAKGAFSDAFKRAAVKWGIGRYLYDMKAPWVAIKQRGKSYVIEDHELTMLRKLAAGEQVQGSPPANSYDPNWKGDFTKTELVEEAKRYCTAIETVIQRSDLDAVLAEYAAIHDTLMKSMPGWVTGDGMNPDFVPIQKRIDDKQAELDSGVMNLRAG